MFTAFSTNKRRSDLGEQKRLHKQQLRARLRRLRRRVHRAVCTERQRALTYRLLAGPFAPDSHQRFFLRMLAQSEMRRKRRLEGLLHELRGSATGSLRRTLVLRWKCWYARHAPRPWIILRLKYGKH